MELKFLSSLSANTDEYEVSPMKNDLTRYCIDVGQSVREALQQLDALSGNAVLFVTEGGRLFASISDGDIRRGLIKGLNLSDKLSAFASQNPKVLRENEFSVDVLRGWRKDNYKIIPVVDGDNRIVDVINFRQQRSYLPIHAIIMAGGLGSRLRPLTLSTPKPLLEVGGKPIIRYNVDRLINFGVKRLTVTVNYLAQQIIDYLGDGSRLGIEIDYITESEPRGTIGAVSDVTSIRNDYVLVMNSDLLTTIDFEEMFAELLEQDAAMIVGTVPYEVKIPYGVVETEGAVITALREKPTYTYYSNAGIYIIARRHLELLPARGVYNATDLLQKLYSSGEKVIQFPIIDYWLDIGKPADYERAQRDIEHINL